MKDNDLHAPFPWTLAFFTNSVCCFAFVGTMKLFDVHLPSVFFRVGVISFVAGVVSFIISAFANSKEMPSNAN